MSRTAAQSTVSKRIGLPDPLAPYERDMEALDKQCDEREAQLTKSTAPAKTPRTSVDWEEYERCREPRKAVDAWLHDERVKLERKHAVTPAKLARGEAKIETLDELAALLRRFLQHAGNLVRASDAPLRWRLDAASACADKLAERFGFDGLPPTPTGVLSVVDEVNYYRLLLEWCERDRSEVVKPKTKGRKSREQYRDEALPYINQRPEITVRELASEIACSEGTAHGILRELRKFKIEVRAAPLPAKNAGQLSDADLRKMIVDADPRHKGRDKLLAKRS